MSDDFAMDKTEFSIAPLANADDDKEYWRSKTPIERIEAVEMMRQILYGGLLIAFMFLRPEGILGSAHRKKPAPASR